MKYCYAVCHKQHGYVMAVCDTRLSAVQWIANAMNKGDERIWIIEKWHLTAHNKPKWGCAATVK